MCSYSGIDRGEYYSVIGTITFFSKDKSLYKACNNVKDGKDCNKKVGLESRGSFFMTSSPLKK